MEPLKYRKGYKYQVAEDWRVIVPEFVGFRVSHPFFEIHENGFLWVKAGYAWNGDDYAWDSIWSRRASLIHDIACQATNEGIARFNLRSPSGDTAYHRVCILDGMPKPMADIRHWFVDNYARSKGKSDPNPILVAP